MLDSFHDLPGAEGVPASAVRPSAATRRLLDELLAENARLRRENAALHRQAALDPLTGLGGRHPFDERLAYEWARAERFWSPLSLLLIGVDGLAAMADRAGVEVADALERGCARLLADGCRDVDIPFCIAPGELAVILPSTNRTGAEAEMKRLQELWGGLRAQLERGGEVSLDFGLAVAFDDAQSPLELICAADESRLRFRLERDRAEPQDDHPTIPTLARPSFIDAA